MDKPLSPPRMPRMVTVDRRALPVTPSLPKHPNDALDEAHDDSEARRIVCNVARWIEARRDAGWI